MLWDILLLFSLGFLGWGVFSRLRMPVAPFLGTLAVLTLLRLAGLDIPLSPAWLFPVLQVLLGIYVGSKITPEAVRDLRPMFKAALLIVGWALSVIFLMGPFLAWTTTLDLYTAILSSSMGGLPEITMIALATEADLGFIIMMQLVRMVVTVAVFPLILKKWMDKAQNPGTGEHTATTGESGHTTAKYNDPVADDTSSETQLHSAKSRIAMRVLVILLAASAGGLLLHYIGVPAGIMVGATLAVGAISLAGVKPVNIPDPVFNVMLVALGIAVADNILPGEFAELTDSRLLIPVLIATVLIFLTSLLVTLLIHRFSGWDLPTSFLAAAPGGFSVMVALSVKYGKDPFKVSMLHLCRLLSIKIALPFVFMYLT